MKTLNFEDFIEKRRNELAIKLLDYEETDSQYVFILGRMTELERFRNVTKEWLKLKLATFPDDENYNYGESQIFEPDASFDYYDKELVDNWKKELLKDLEKIFTKQSIYKERDPNSKLFICEYPNCNKETEIKAKGKLPLCSKHRSLYLFIERLLRELKQK